MGIYRDTWIAAISAFCRAEMNGINQSRYENAILWEYLNGQSGAHFYDAGSGYVTMTTDIDSLFLCNPWCGAEAVEGDVFSFSMSHDAIFVINKPKV